MTDTSAAHRWGRAHAILDAILDLPAPERAAAVAMRCAGDDALAADVRKWLAGCDAVLAGLPDEADLLGDSFANARTDVAISAPERIGHYRVIRVAGEGGMGTVYEGVRDDGEFRQRVAIKLIRSSVGMRPEFVQRFRTERQILASLAHPHIARLLDGGVTADGAPYCVLEYVDGEPLLAWCDARRLDVRARVALARQLCDAVRYAHQRLVVHRDLKPSNVLVSADGSAMLLDFGLARLLSDGSDVPAITRPGAPPALTPEYASPEQFRGEPLGVSTDVYSLGVMLCELLTGRRPSGDARGWAALEAATNTRDAPAPSTLVGDREHAARRLSSVAALRRLLRGDLDRIVCRALEREPGRRYQSVEQLDDDLGRFLAGRPVLASRGGARYRARKFIARHRWSVAASTILLALLAGSGASTVRESRRAAEAAVRAGAERNAAEEVSRLLLGLFELPFPFDSGGRTRSLRPLLDSAAARLTDSASSLGEQRPELLRSLSTGYYGLGDFDRAADLARRTVRGLELRGAGLEAIGDAYLALAEMLRAAGRPADAFPAYEAASRALGQAIGADHARIGRVWLARARAYRAVSDTAAARRGLDSAFTRFRRDSASNELALANAWETAAQLALDGGQLDEAERAYRTTQRLRVHALAPVAEVAGTIGDLGRVELRRGHVRAADSLLNIALARKRDALGPEHPETADEYAALAEVRLAERRPAEALVLIDRALAAFTAARSTPPWRLTPARATRAQAVAALRATRMRSAR